MGMILFLLMIQKACSVEKFNMGSGWLDLGGYLPVMYFSNTLIQACFI